MTKAEVERFIEGAIWRMKEKAQWDYCLSNLIGVSVGRLFDKSATFPPIYEVYPTLFKEEAEKIQEEEDNDTSSINNFMAFAMAHNKKI